ncbi:GMC family oxidoreductase N-terminal domain-containing protein [bacterium]
MKTIKKKADVVVAGSGPGGATVAMKMAQAGKKTILLEKGRDLRFVGNHFTGLMMADKMGLNFTEEGLNIVRAVVTGGSTIMYCGAATPPPEMLKTKYGLDLEKYSDETIKELNLEPLPDEVIGTAGFRIMEAGNELGYKFEKMRKFIDPEKCRSRCGGTCMLGCPVGAKWTSREYIKDMKEAGGELVTRADVQHVEVRDGTATGMLAKIPGGILEVEADVVVVSAGGIGTPSILQKSGIHEAGVGMFVDPLLFVTGVSRHKGTCTGPPMTVGTYDMVDEGILLSDLIDPWGMWLIMTAISNPSKLLNFFSYKKQLGLMVKIGDERQGFITLNGKISKPLTERDRKRLNRGAAISRDILIKAGCDPRSIMVGPVRGAHPGATARVGKIVNENLETEVKNLFVSDASVLPEALDQPVVLTVVSLAKRLSDHLLSNVFEKSPA